MITKTQKNVMHHTDPKAIELETAKEILAEVFRIRISEVEVMIQNRFEDALITEDCPEETGRWPQEFRLDM